MNLRGFGPPTLINRSLKLKTMNPLKKNLKMPNKNIFVSVNGPNFWKFHVDQIASEDSEIQARKFNCVKDPS